MTCDLANHQQWSNQGRIFGCKLTCSIIPSRQYSSQYQSIGYAKEIWKQVEGFSNLIHNNWTEQIFPATYIKRIPLFPLLRFSNSVPQFAYMQSQACRLFPYYNPCARITTTTLSVFQYKQTTYIYLSRLVATTKIIGTVTNAQYCEKVATTHNL